MTSCSNRKPNKLTAPCGCKENTDCEWCGGVSYLTPKVKDIKLSLTKAAKLKAELSRALQD